MARSCVYHTVQTCDGGPWVNYGEPFRGTREVIEARFQAACSQVAKTTSVRVTESKVIFQRDGAKNSR